MEIVEQLPCPPRLGIVPGLRVTASDVRLRRAIVEGNPDPLGVRVVLIDELAHTLREIDVRSLVGDLGVSPRTVDGDEIEDVRCAVAHVFIVGAGTLPGFGTDGDPFFADELARCLVEAHHGSMLVGWLGVEREHVLDLLQLTFSLDGGRSEFREFWPIRSANAAIRWVSAATWLSASDNHQWIAA